MDLAKARKFITDARRNVITLHSQEYNSRVMGSPPFDDHSHQNQCLEEMLQVTSSWLRTVVPQDVDVTIHGFKKRAPIMRVEFPGTLPGCILMYGHLAQQTPIQPFSSDGREHAVNTGEALPNQLGGMGGNLGWYSSITALCALRDQGLDHPRCLIVVDTDIENQSVKDVEDQGQFESVIGSPDVVICFDSQVNDHKRLWVTTSLRGLITGELTVEVLRHPMQSGHASGIVPCSFRIMRQLLERLEDSSTGEIRLDALHAEVPRERVAQARAVAAALGSCVSNQFPWSDNTQPTSPDRVECLLNRSWRPALTLKGSPRDAATTIEVSADMPPSTTLKLHLLTPPSVDVEAGIKALQNCLTQNPPYDAKIHVATEGTKGWVAPLIRPWLHAALERASETWFDAPAMYQSGGTDVSRMAILKLALPRAQVVLMNAPNPSPNPATTTECSDADMVIRLTGALASLVNALSRRAQQKGRII